MDDGGQVRLIPEAPDLPHRLGRHQNWDPCNRLFPFAAPPAREIRSVSHRRLVPAYEQRVGSCVLNACFGVLSTQPDHHRFRSQNTIERWYSDVTHRDPFDGAWNWRDRSGQDTGTDATSACNLLLERGRISRFEHVFNGRDGVLAALQDRPVLVGWWWLSGMWEVEPDGRLRCQGSRVGGHEPYLYGVDVERRRVWGWNSWGQWGPLGGRFYLTWNDLGERMDDDGDSTVMYPR